jgi:hypothetical protein
MIIWGSENDGLSHEWRTASPSSSIVCRVLLAVWLRARIDHEGIAAEAHLD